MSEEVIVFYQGLNSSFYQHNRFTDINLPPGIKFREKDFVSFNSKNRIHDIDEVVYWCQATLIEKLILLPWFFVNWLIRFYFQIYYPTKAQAIAPIHAIKWWLINVAQDRDVREHRKRLDIASIRHNKQKKMVLGVSRGAATTFCSIASIPNSQLRHYNVKLVVLEGCFDSVPSVLQARYGKYLAIVVEYLLHFLTEYDMKKARDCSPIAMAKYFPQKIPIALITSSVDKDVPFECTQRLHDALKEAGHKNIFHLTLAKGHNEYFTGSDAVSYRQFLSGLKKKFIS